MAQHGSACPLRSSPDGWVPQPVGGLWCLYLRCLRSSKAPTGWRFPASAICFPHILTSLHRVLQSAPCSLRETLNAADMLFLMHPYTGLMEHHHQHLHLRLAHCSGKERGGRGCRYLKSESILRRGSAVTGDLLLISL
ncbi:hypothetical protein AAFF_G00232890 [Aldrovandia affinis]|uniref:Uncharacterized protein n=1 Tax=Aldrovandia affinis TaxID=143900 RepID=A0AAD7REQ0_9TELE|nr:hypothetical protein AAFF_G00232890 [Aldrovandia affinis]